MLLALFALFLPREVRQFAAVFRPPSAVVVYALPAAGDELRLVWNPRGCAGRPELAEGRLRLPDGSSGAPVGSAAGLLLGNPLELDRASALDLQALPGVGPKTAAAILAWRETHGSFVTVDDLLGVRGIGPKTLAALRSWVWVGPGEPTASAVSHNPSPL